MTDRIQLDWIETGGFSLDTCASSGKTATSLIFSLMTFQLFSESPLTLRYPSILPSLTLRYLDPPLAFRCFVTVFRLIWLKCRRNCQKCRRNAGKQRQIRSKVRENRGKSGANTGIQASYTPSCIPSLYTRVHHLPIPSDRSAPRDIEASTNKNRALGSRLETLFVREGLEVFSYGSL